MDNNTGYIKLHRKILDNPIVCKDSDYFAVWIYLLLKATHKSCKAFFKNKEIDLMPGQLITGRKKIASEQQISEAKVERILKSLKIGHQIEQQTSNKNRLITIVNWTLYQNSEQQNEQQVNNKRTTSEQQVNTYKNNKNVNNEKNNNIYSRVDDFKTIVDFLNSKLGTKFKYTTKSTQEKINARLNEGFKLDDFIIVIDKKVKEWNGTDMEKYLRPETLFGTKFEGYLNQKSKVQNQKPEIIYMEGGFKL